MKGFTAFLGKELREYIRTKRLMIIMIVFLIVGIMNPAVAKLTPKLMEMMSDEIAAAGITVNEVNITALDSWAQFLKNMPLAMAAVIIMLSGTYTAEYSKGTLIPLLTKGLSRSCVVLSKFAVMLITWSAGMWLCFGLTYFYSGYYWDNSIVKGLVFAGFGWWLFGVLMISCIVFFSSFASSGAQVMLCVGAVYFGMTVIGLIEKAREYLPTHLLDSGALFTGEASASDFTAAVIISAVLSAALVPAAIPITKNRRL